MPGASESAVPPAVTVFPPAALIQPAETAEPGGAPALAIPSGVSRALLSGPSLVNIGDPFTVDVLVDEVHNLYSAPLFVDYNPQLLEFVRTEEGDFLKQGGQATIFTSSANPAAGKIIIGNKRSVAGSGASGSGKLLHLVFKAKAAGTASLRLDRLNFRDPNGNRLPVTVAGITVEVR
jgi:general secretion pathway protein D